MLSTLEEVTINGVKINKDITALARPGED